MSFKNKVVLITGGSSGIGASTSELFAKESANIVIVGRNEANLKKVADSCQKLGGTVLAVKADVTSDEDLKNVIKQTIEKFGKLNVLVNNAGILTLGSILKEDLMKDFDRTINTNLRSTVCLTNLAAPHLVKTKGNVVNVSSILGKSLLGHGEYLAYCVSKAGLDHFTRSAALGLSSVGVRVNSVNPGPTRTEVVATAGVPITWEEIATTMKIDRVSEPEEIGELILFLASDKARSITGATYVIDNGALLKN